VLLHATFEGKFGCSLTHVKEHFHEKQGRVTVLNFNSHNDVATRVDQLAELLRRKGD
jgi:hypothetical protein